MLYVQWFVYRYLLFKPDRLVGLLGLNPLRPFSDQILYAIVCKFNRYGGPLYKYILHKSRTLELFAYLFPANESL